MSEELAKAGTQEVAAPAEKKLFATAESVTDQQAIEAIMDAPQLHLNMVPSTWSPLQVGERKRLVFQELIKDAETKNKYRQSEKDPEFVKKDKVVFVEVYREGDQIKQRMIQSYATMLVGYIRSHEVVRHAILDVEYEGKKQGDKFNYDSFKVIPVPVQ